MFTRARLVGRSITAAAVLLVGAHQALGSQPATTQPKEQDKPAPAAAPDKDAPDAKKELEAAEKLYSSAKTYKDKGEVKTEMDIGGMPADVKPFSTAFERDGRFLWQFKHSAMPGRPADKEYTVWSKDQKSFSSYWTLNGTRSADMPFNLAMAGPTGVSGGSATVVVPLLRPDAFMGLQTTKITDPSVKGKEQVDGVECTKIVGKGLGDSDVTIWLDPAHAIRKVYMVWVIDPSKMELPNGAPKTPKFTAKTTITITPTFNEKIDDKEFEPPAQK